MNPRERSVIARLNTGLAVRGTTIDFNPEKPSFWVTPEGGTRGVEVKVKDLKALFFPKLDSESEEPRRRPRYGQMDPAKDGKRIVVHFEDGEWMTGHTLSYRPEKIGFFLFPDDPETQHEKIFIYSGVVTQVLTGSEAESHPVAVRRQRREAA
jgi:Family of unknown function (DUF6982)